MVKQRKQLFEEIMARRETNHEENKTDYWEYRLIKYRIVYLSTLELAVSAVDSCHVTMNHPNSIKSQPRNHEKEIITIVN